MKSLCLPIHVHFITKHWTDSIIESPAKPVNAPLIEQFTNVQNYKGRADQLEVVMEYVTLENYGDMFERVCELETSDLVVGGSNFGRFLKLFESDDVGWIDRINDVLDS